MTTASRLELACVLLAVAGYGCDEDTDNCIVDSPRAAAEILEPAPGQSMAHNVANSDRLLFVDEGGRLHRSEDGGNSWQIDAMSREYAVDSIYPGSVAGNHLCIRRMSWLEIHSHWQASCSSDDGMTWRDAQPLELYSGRLQVTPLFIHQSRPTRIFTLFSDNPTDKLMRDGSSTPVVLPHSRIAFTDDYGAHWSFAEGLHDVELMDISDPKGISLDGMLFDTDLKRTGTAAEPNIESTCESGRQRPWDRVCFIQGRVFGAVNGLMWEYLESSQSWRCKVPEESCASAHQRVRSS